MALKDIPIKSDLPSREENPVTTGCEQKEPFALLVMGDSMEPEFCDGDVIIIEPGCEMAHHECYVLAYHNDEYTFRQLIVRQDRYYLHPLNDKYVTDQIDSLDAIKGVISQKKSPGGGRKGIKKYL